MGNKVKDAGHEFGPGEYKTGKTKLTPVGKIIRRSINYYLWF